jgi:hypothetical protein
MQYRDLKNKAKKLGLRVTKTIDGKRVKLSARELRSKITMNFENSVKNAQKVIHICRTVVLPASGAPAPPPLPPKRVAPPPGGDVRAKLLAELKNALKRRKI